MKQKLYLFYLLLFVLLGSITSKAQSFTENFNTTSGQFVNSFTKTLSGVPFTFTANNGTTYWTNAGGALNSQCVQLYQDFDPSSIDTFVIKRQDGNDFVFNSLFLKSESTSNIVVAGYNNNVLVGSIQTLAANANATLNFGGIVVDEVIIKSTNLNVNIDDFSGIVVSSATHLNFDGANDNVTIPSAVSGAIAQGSEITIEYWFKGTNLQSAVRIQNGSNYIVAGWGSSNPQFIVSTDGETNGVLNGTESVIEDNTWHHIACVWKKNEIFATYLDGVLQNSRVAANVNLPNLAGTEGKLGSLNGGSEFMTGNLDDVRIWNVARTASQISANRNCELQGNESGLVAYYKFNQGLDAADNTTITTLTDATANANNGTLVNFAKTGTTSNFLAGSPVMTGSIVPSNATVTTPVVYTQGDTATALTATTGANGSNLLWYTTSTGGTGTTAPTPSTATVGSTSYWVSSTNANGCESARTEIVVTVNASIPATHLNFDGVNDRVELSNESNFDFTSTFSIEAWIRVNSFTQEWQTLISKGAEGPRIHRFGVSDFIAFGTGPADDLVSTVSVNDGNWHHIAATCNNGFKSLYVDGVLQGTQIVGTPLVTNNDNVRIGSQIDSYSPIRAFHGDIDEVRIWNVARTAEQTNGSKNCELQGNETGLVANYKFNQGIDAAVNTAITSLIDATANGNNGTLVNFTKTGTTSNFLAGSPVTTGSIIPSVATVTTPVTYTQGATATALTATVGANGSSLVWYTTATGGTGTTAPTPSTATVGSTSYWVSSTNANGCESARTEIVVTVNSVPATHLNFDGVNDYVNLSNLISGGSSYTKQAMIRPTYIASGAGQNIISNSNEVFWIFDGNIRAGNNGNFQHVLADASSLLNTWNMVTVTYDAPTTTMKLYINEILVSENNSVSATVGGNIQIGAFASIAFFNGDIDEVRIWNRALPLAEIQNNMNCELPSPSTQNSLVAYYKFNQGTDAADNTTITTLTDASGNANNGTLVNFTKTGTTSNFLAGSPIVTGTNCAVLSNESFEVANNIKMYPNPTNGIFTIETQEVSTVDVFDMIGKKVYSNKVSVGSSNIDLSNYTNGIYLLTVTNQKGNLNTYKLIKE